jgi:nitroreductase
MIAGKYSDSLIYKRHSVRKYKGDAVTPEQLYHTLHSAMASPSANNALFKIPDTLFPFRVVAFGKPIDTFQPSGRYDASRAHRNSW